MTDIDLEGIAAERKRVVDTYLAEESKRPGPSARGIHHVALLCSNVEKTVQFYQGILEFPLLEIFENRDYVGSSHFFFDLGHGNTLAFFDFPGLDLGPYAEVLGGLHHVAISVELERWKTLRANLEKAGIEYAPAQRSVGVLPRPRWGPYRVDCRPARRNVRDQVGELAGLTP